MSIQAPFFTAAGEPKGNIDLSEEIFGDSGSRYVLHEVILAYQRNRRSGTSSTKTRGFVSGGGRKPWKQKGTGNARAGSIRSPLWRGGGIIFGPLPRSYRVDLDAAKRSTALKTALFEKLKAGDVAVLDAFKLADAKTQSAAKMLQKARAGARSLLVLDKRDDQAERAFRNLSGFRLAVASELNALTVLAAKRIIFTKAALEALAARFPKG